MNYKEIKKELNITDAEISSAFGYKDVNSFRNSVRKSNIQNGVEFIFNLVRSNKT